MTRVGRFATVAGSRGTLVVIVAPDVVPRGLLVSDPLSLPALRDNWVGRSVEIWVNGVKIEYLVDTGSPCSWRVWLVNFL